jgi:hypothetical protein
MGNQPGQFQPRGEDWIVRKIQEIERGLTELRAANVFGRTGITPKDGGTDFDGYVNINGPLDINGDGTVNGPLEVNGDSEFNGSLSINGPLNLQPGSIQNDALTSPTFTASAYGDAYEFALTTVEATIATATIPIPAGYTKATVTGIGAIYVYNSKTTADYGYGRVYVDWPSGASNWGAKIPFALGPNGGSGNSSPNRLVEKTGLSGGNITVRLVAESDGGIPAAVSNQATINALVLFTR